jgi:hypothetical protein
VDAVLPDAAAGARVVTQRAFQATVARLVIDPDFRERVRADGPGVLDGDLTPLERERVRAVAGDQGLDFTRTLHKNFRLTKIYTLLPLTRALLGPARLAREVGAFWKAEPSVSHYFLEEALAFCDFLQHRLRAGLRIKYLREVVAYERAHLDLQRPRPHGEAPEPQVVTFDHDPATLFEGLVRGHAPRAVPVSSCRLVGRLRHDGDVEWTAVPTSAAPARRS